MENLRDENSAQTGWLVRSPAQALVHLVWVRMIHTCLANGEGRELGRSHLIALVTAGQGGGRDTVVLDFTFLSELTLLKLWK